jgi:hypothetical protein
MSSRAWVQMDANTGRGSLSLDAPERSGSRGRLMQVSYQGAYGVHKNVQSLMQQGVATGCGRKGAARKQRLIAG